MPLFVCSDLHLGEPGEAAMFHDERQGMPDRATDAAGPVDAALPLLELREEPHRLLATLRDLAGHGCALQSFEVPT